MFEHLDDPSPPGPRPGALSETTARGKAIRRRRRVTGIGVAALMPVALIAGAPRGSHGVRVASHGPSATSTSATPTTATTTAPSPTAAARSIPVPTTAPVLTPPTTVLRQWRDGVITRPQHAPIRLTVSLARTTLRSGESVTGTLRAENTSADTIDITHPWSCPIDDGIWKRDSFYTDTTPQYEGGWDRSQTNCGTQPVADSVAPHEVRTWNFTLDTLSGDQDFRPNPGPRQPIAPGVYDVAAGLWLSSRGGVWYAIPVTLEIKN